MHRVEVRRPPRNGKPFLGYVVTVEGGRHVVIKYKESEAGGQYGPFIWAEMDGNGWAEQTLTHWCKLPKRHKK